MNTKLLSSPLAMLRVALQSSCLLYSVFCILPLLPLQAAIAPLAQNHVVVDESPDPPNVALYTPSILALPDGRLLAANERSGLWKKLGNPNTRIYTSDDHGATWQLRTTGNITHGRLFAAGKSIYYLGHLNDTDLQIMRSDDNGITWSKQVPLTSGQYWHQSACNVWHAKGNVYLVMERVMLRTSGPGDYAPVLMRAKETDDLTKRESWTFAQNELCFANMIPDYATNNLPFEYFGVPFYNQKFPDRNVLATKPNRNMGPMGWYETNVVQITDPNHYWFDPTGNTFHLFMRSNTGGTGYACMAKVVENKDGTMTTSLEHVPSGKIQLFIPMPGGQMRFHVLYDEKTKLYWLLSSQATDSMTRIEKLPPDRFNLPNDERQRLVLHFSKNMVDWCFAGLVAKADANNESRHYASMDIDGDDLVILSRSGDKNAKTAHNGNIATFHRVKNFRDLVY